MRIFCFDIKFRKLSCAKKGCRNTMQRKLERIAFFERNNKMLENALSDCVDTYFYMKYKTKNGIIVIVKARKELGFSKNSYSADIYNSLMHGYLKWRAMP